MTIGERIKQRRLELKMSQEELAQKVGYKSRTSINKIELNGREIRQSKIKAIADALETTPDYIMGWQDTMETYYSEPDTAEMAQEIFENKELSLLFDAARGVDPETLAEVRNYLLTKKKMEAYSGDDPA